MTDFLRLHTFCKQHNLPKSSVHNFLTKERNFDVSEGLSDEAIEAIRAKFGSQMKQSVEPKTETSEPFTTGAMVISPKVEVMPANGYGKQFDLGSTQEIHLHIHTGNGLAYRQQMQASDSTTQNAIHALLDQARRQGQEDRDEVDSVVQAVKSKLIETRVTNIALGKPVESQSMPATDHQNGGDGLDESFGGK